MMCLRDLPEKDRFAVVYVEEQCRKSITGTWLVPSYYGRAKDFKSHPVTLGQIKRLVRLGYLSASTHTVSVWKSPKGSRSRLTGFNEYYEIVVEGDVV